MVKRVTLTLSDEEAAALEEAARLADRAPEDFAREELVDLARTIRDAGTTDAVELARHRAEDRSRTLDQFLAAGDGDKPVRDWGRTQTAAVAAMAYTSGPAVRKSDGRPAIDQLRGHWPRSVDQDGPNGGPPPRRPRRGAPVGGPSGMGGKRS